MTMMIMYYTFNPGKHKLEELHYINNYSDKHLFFLNSFHKAIRDKLTKYSIDFCRTQEFVIIKVQLLFLLIVLRCIHSAVWKL